MPKFRPPELGDLAFPVSFELPTNQTGNRRKQPPRVAEKLKPELEDIRSHESGNVGGWLYQCLL